MTSIGRAARIVPQAVLGAKSGGSTLQFSLARSVACSARWCVLVTLNDATKAARPIALAAPRLRDHSVAEPVGVAFAAPRQLDDSCRDDFPYAVYLASTLQVIQWLPPRCVILIK